MAIAREAEPVNSLKEVREAGLDREDLLGLYRTMLITRGIEEMATFLGQLYNREVTDEDLVTVIRFSKIKV